MLNLSDTIFPLKYLKKLFAEILPYLVNENKIQDTLETMNQVQKTSSAENWENNKSLAMLRRLQDKWF